MAEFVFDERDLRFMLYEVLNIESLCAYPYHQDHSREIFDMSIDAAVKLAKNYYWPAFEEIDREGAVFDEGKTTVPRAVHQALKATREGGWIAPSAPFEFGGQQMPVTVQNAISYILCSANPTIQIYGEGMFGAGHLLESHAPEPIKALYLKRLYTGEWGGTMALTEPDAGSSLADTRATARRIEEQGHYNIKGTKIFITSGDHDLTDNIIHMTLARVDGAPPGVKGISLFLVPKYRVNPDGTLGESNDVTTIKIEKKMGLKGSATALLNLGENNQCRAWLVGQENRGLSCMFQLMNEARIHTGIQAIALAANAYQLALRYSGERLQGRPLTERSPETKPIPIIGHADVRRMLLAQKSYVEGVTNLLFYTSRCVDHALQLGRDSSEGRHYHYLTEILTPICKAYGSDIGFESIRLAVQCFGGYGYCTEYQVEQMLRDCKVFSLYEGTNGIQAQDLLGRKITIDQGACYKALMSEIEQDIETAGSVAGLEEMAGSLDEAKEAVKKTTEHLLGFSGRDIELFMAQATIYLEFFSQLVVAWQHLLRSLAAQRAVSSGSGNPAFYRGKIETARYYLNNVLPHALATARIIQSDERTALDMIADRF